MRTKPPSNRELADQLDLIIEKLDNPPKPQPNKVKLRLQMCQLFGTILILFCWYFQTQIVTKSQKIGSIQTLENKHYQILTLAYQFGLKDLMLDTNGFIDHMAKTNAVADKMMQLLVIDYNLIDQLPTNVEINSISYTSFDTTQLKNGIRKEMSELEGMMFSGKYDEIKEMGAFAEKMERNQEYINFHMGYRTALSQWLSTYIPMYNLMYVIGSILIILGLFKDFPKIKRKKLKLSEDA